MRIRWRLSPYWPARPPVWSWCIAWCNHVLRIIAEGWPGRVDLDRWLHAEMVYTCPQMATHLSTNRARLSIEQLCTVIETNDRRLIARFRSRLRESGTVYRRVCSLLHHFQSLSYFEINTVYLFISNCRLLSV